MTVGEPVAVGDPLNVRTSAPAIGRSASIPGPGPVAGPAAVAGPSPWRLRTAANGVTAVRMAFAPVLVAVVLHSSPSWPTVGLWAALALSDGADGWLARRRGTSASGAFLDPLADKLLVLGAAGALASLGHFSWWPVTLLGARELLITLYRVVVARKGVSVPARRSAKAKTLVEFAAVTLALVPVSWRGHYSAASACLWAAVVLAWVSCCQYLLDSRAAGERPAVSAT